MQKMELTHTYIELYLAYLFITWQINWKCRCQQYWQAMDRCVCVCVCCIQMRLIRIDYHGDKLHTHINYALESMPQN